MNASDDLVAIDRRLLAALARLAARGARCEDDADTVAEARRLARTWTSPPTRRSR